MKLLFVKSNKVGSRVIRWGLRSDCSHFAVCFDEDSLGSGIVFHSYGLGTKLEWLGEFDKHFEVVHALEFKTKLAVCDEETIYQRLLQLYSGKRYDYPALAWWTWRALLNRLFGVPIGVKNRWSVEGMLLCTAVAGGIEWIKKYCSEKNVDLEMIPPHDLYDLLAESGYFVDAVEWLQSLS